MSTFKAGDKIAVFAIAKLDQGWTEQPSGDDVKLRVPPMSHVVNARTNVNWQHSSTRKVIQGRQEWFSIPLTIVISESDTDDSKDVESSHWLIMHGMVIDEAHANEAADDFLYIRPSVFIAMSVAGTFHCVQGCEQVDVSKEVYQTIVWWKLRKLGWIN